MLKRICKQVKKDGKYLKVGIAKKTGYLRHAEKIKLKNKTETFTKWKTDEG